MKVGTTPNLIEDKLPFIQDFEYFNVEISPCKTTLVINASKKGIDKFLKLHSSFLVPTKNILLKNHHRPQRRWFSWMILDNENVTAANLTTYLAEPNGYRLNDLANYLRIDRVLGMDLEPIICVGMKDGIPILTVNEKGWQQFLEILKCLRDESYWFYVTPPNPLFKQTLKFSLSTHYLGNSQDHVFKAIECIRLEPEKKIYLRTYIDLVELEENRKSGVYLKPNYLFGTSITIAGNSTGFLLLSAWLHDFAIGNEQSKEIINKWNDNFKNLDPISIFSEISIHTTRIFFRKTPVSSTNSIFSFEGKDDGSSDLYISGNSEGLEDLGKILEQSAFYSDHDYYPEAANSHNRCKEEPVEGILGGSDLLSLRGWEIVGGGYYTPKYCYFNLFGNENDEFGLKQEIFLDKRILLND